MASFSDKITDREFDTIDLLDDIQQFYSNLGEELVELNKKLLGFYNTVDDNVDKEFSSLFTEEFKKLMEIREVYLKLDKELDKYRWNTKKKRDKFISYLHKKHS